ncbi:ABC transporter substrate-binding protein [Marinivivus vitaminiproducens]|uniref:ABC transporter substrate-binding protein n=1 Tax=Marinivivus vitaminiproducens TaxID=3035935 RepID=UPI0027A31300|nr:sugar ABC transporter substrate-binding protein [Geminicoccaceae bacterium SCSIO 64248]
MPVVSRLAGIVAAVAAIAATGVAKAEPVKLTWLMWSGSEAEVEAWKHVAGLVTEEHPDITVEFQTTSFPDYWTKLPVLAASNQLPDIVSLQAQRAPGFVDLMTPLDDLIEADGFDIDAFDPSIVEGLSRDGERFAIPYDFGPLILYYNRDLFAQAGVPEPKPGWTEAAFNEAARALTTGDRFGFAVSIPDAFMTYALSTGAHYLDEDGELDLTSQGMVDAFKRYAELVSTEKVAPLMPSSGTQSSSMAAARFTSGNVAMHVNGPWQMINIKGKSGFTVGVAPVPAGAAGSISVSAGSGFGISASSPNQEAAWKAIKVMTGPKAEQYLAEQGRAFPARTAQQSFWYDKAAEGVVGAREGIPAAIATARPYATTPAWASVSALFEQYAPVAFAGSESPEEVLETIQALSDQ